MLAACRGGHGCALAAPCIQAAAAQPPRAATGSGGRQQRRQRQHRSASSCACASACSSSGSGDSGSTRGMLQRRQRRRAGRAAAAAAAGGDEPAPDVDMQQAFQLAAQRSAALEDYRLLMQARGGLWGPEGWWWRWRAAGPTAAAGLPFSLGPAARQHFGSGFCPAIAPLAQKDDDSLPPAAPCRIHLQVLVAVFYLAPWCAPPSCRSRTARSTCCAARP